MTSLHGMTNIKKLCRICLTEGSENISLNNALQRKRNDSPRIFWALEKVMSVKIQHEDCYPSEICPNCLRLLNISYELREQFEISQQALKEHFGKCFEEIEENDDNNTKIEENYDDNNTKIEENDDNNWDSTMSSEEYTEEKYIVFEENNFLTPNVKENVGKNRYNINNVYKENLQNLEESVHLKNNKEKAKQSKEDSGIIKNNSNQESNELMNEIDSHKYIIEKPVNSAVNIRGDYDLKHLSRLDEELIQAAYNLKYECPGCPKVYSSLKNLLKHKEICVKLKRLTKSQSQLVTIDAKNENVNLVANEYSLLYECDRCPKLYPSSEELERHIQWEHFDPKPNIYEEFKLEDLSEIDQELFKSALLLKYECDTCTKIYSSPDKLEKHKATCEKLKRKPVSIQVDGKISSNQSDEVILFSEAHNSEVTRVKLEEDINFERKADRSLFESALNLQHKCPKCSRLYSSEVRFKKHLTICGLKKTSQNAQQNEYMGAYTCDICGHISTSKQNEFYHKQTAHEEKKYSCEKCGKLFALKSVLKKHMQTHSKDKIKVVCPVCGKGFHYSSGLFYHMKMHRNELNYLCDYCERRFINLNALKRHLATHTGERHYQCKFCEKRFKGSAEVRRHEMRHTGSRPHHCKYCAKNFPNKYNLQVHIISHAGNVPCNWCKKTFLNADVLQLHLKMKHKIQGENPLDTTKKIL